MANDAPQSLVYTPREAARLIHPELSHRTMARWRSMGTGPSYVKVGRRVGYTREAIEAYINNQEVKLR